ncbi:MAG TPA: acyl-CoA dehydratase activase [Methanocorpusculum sp.]|nr:acyl-CoA dehydratase activase [Methanocorpusculum sp.]
MTDSVYNIGIDIGSTSAKMAVLSEDDVLCKTVQIPTGWSSSDAASALLHEIEQNGYAGENTRIVATGYGRISVPFADKKMTEISCHAKGAVYLFREQNLTLIDIGGQDTKVIRINNGQVTDFLMNDKCSAGTGRFLEIMANRLGLRPDELCSLAETGHGISISSLCTVFAESEVISLIGRGEKKENIANAVVASIVRKVGTQAKRLDDSDTPLCLSGGLSTMPYLPSALGFELNKTLRTHESGVFAGALGAALFAGDRK